MSKIYQPFILEKVEEILIVLEETNFFEEHELEDRSFAKKYMSDILTNKFINGQIDSESTEIFTEDEFGNMLKQIIAGTVLLELKKKGYVNSYEDDDTEEIFFLTEEGKIALTQMIKDDDL
jgi:hypothetical protein